MFDSIELINYTSFASPHVGVLTLGTGLAARMFNGFAPYALAYTSKQLFLKDKVPVHFFKPLLYCLADPTLPFYQALTKFRQCSLYANAINDHRTEFYTSAINQTVTNSSLLYRPAIPNYGNTVIDYAGALNFAKELEKSKKENQLAKHTSEKVGLGIYQFGAKVFRWSYLLINITVVMPIWACCSITNSVFQSFSAWIRKRNFLKSDIFFDYHDESLLKPLLDSAADFNPTVSDRLTEHAGEAFESVLEAVNYDAEKTQFHPEAEHSQSSNVLVGAAESTVDETECNLNLNEDQKFIIKNLNAINWKKFPVYIRNAKHTHAAIICRFPNPQFEEGKNVINHWLNEVFISC